MLDVLPSCHQHHYMHASQLVMYDPVHVGSRQPRLSVAHLEAVHPRPRTRNRLLPIDFSQAKLLS